jgi:hypothetical protein
VDTEALSLLPVESPEAAKSDEDVTRRALDELFSLTRQYKSTQSYHNLLEFIARFRFYAPYNAMLVHVQMPGATFVCPPHRWRDNYRHRIRFGARPLVILQPMGPVMFVFDVSDTEPLDGAPPLPREVTYPFEPRGAKVGNQLDQTIENAKRDGVRVGSRDAGSQSAGVIRVANAAGYLEVTTKLKPQREFVKVAVKYEILLNSDQSREGRYATLVHEFAHLYCGHLGIPNQKWKWWPDRKGLSEGIREFEAESVCYLVCQRLGIDNPSHEYLAGYVDNNKDKDVPPISLECVMAASGLIEKMGRERLKPRKDGSPVKE